MPTSGSPRLRLGVSDCLLGASVRYDGGHQWNHFVAARLAPLVEWVGVCPESEAGMGTPRPPVELRGDPQRPRVVEVGSGRDHTDRLVGTSTEGAAWLVGGGLDGFVLKSKSPSCGLRDVPVHTEIGPAAGDGVFARALATIDPNLPLCREDDLLDEELRRAFFVRCISRAHGRALLRQRGTSAAPSSEAALDFFERHRLALIARGFDADAARADFADADDLESALDTLASDLSRPELLEGTLHALELAIDELTGLDPRHWFAFAPMLAQVRSISMRPQVLRVTLHLVAQVHRKTSLLREFYLHPWTHDLADDSPAEPAPPADAPGGDA